MIALRAIAPLHHPLNRYAVTGGALRRVPVETKLVCLVYVHEGIVTQVELGYNSPCAIHPRPEGQGLSRKRVTEFYDNTGHLRGKFYGEPEKRPK